MNVKSTFQLFLLFSALTLLFFCPSKAFCQLETWLNSAPDSCDLLFVRPYMHFPPLQSDMPFDIMVGWLIADSLTKNATYEELYAHAKQMPRDSLILALRYYYKVRHYDPLLWYTYHIDLDSIPHKSFPAAIYRAAKTAYEERFGNLNEKDIDLLETEFILHVKVLHEVSNTYYRPYSIRDKYFEHFCTDIEVIENVSGQKIYSNCYDPGTPNRQMLNTNKCMRIWRVRTPPEHTITRRDSIWSEYHGHSFFEIGAEYIIFLDYSVDYSKGKNEYAFFLHNRIFENPNNNAPFPGLDQVFKIDNNMVLDPENYWGLGTMVDVTSFKQNIISRINNIIGL